MVLARTAHLLPQITARNELFLRPSRPVILEKDSVPLQSFQSPPEPPSLPTPSASTSSNSSSRISPAVLFIIVILAVIFFISGLLHLLVRFLIRKNPSSTSATGYPASADAPGSDALQRQLQQLFHLHDSGLDQAFIDALPVFLYREVLGLKEPFDCAVCLCEFASDDRLRLLPLCGHAFHICCIDTWLLSNSTCPLCRSALFVQGLAIENPVFEFDDGRDEEEGIMAAARENKEADGETRVFPVRLGKFRRLSNGDDEGVCNNARREVGESSRSNLDARRCYSLGSYQYIVGDAELRVALPGSKPTKERKLGSDASNGDAVEEVGKRLGAGTKGDSFSMSKIWMWPNKKGKLPASSVAMPGDGDMPWTKRRHTLDIHDCSV